MFMKYAAAMKFDEKKDAQGFAATSLIGETNVPFEVRLGQTNKYYEDYTNWLYTVDILVP